MIIQRQNIINYDEDPTYIFSSEPLDDKSSSSDSNLLGSVNLIGSSLSVDRGIAGIGGNGQFGSLTINYTFHSNAIVFFPFNAISLICLSLSASFAIIHFQHLTFIVLKYLNLWSESLKSISMLHTW